MYFLMEISFETYIRYLGCQVVKCCLQVFVQAERILGLRDMQATIKEHQPQKPKRLSAQACDVAAYFFSPRRKRSQISLAAPA